MTKKKSKETNFDPKIVGFVCNWSTYRINERDGFSFSGNIQFIRLMCLGRINPSFIFSAFEFGADGIILLGCPPGDCHYCFGNKLANEHFNEAIKLTHLLGIEKERLCLVQYSITEDLKLVKNMKRFVEKVKKLGPSPLKNGPRKVL